MTTAENIKLSLNEKAHGYAKIYASLLSDEFQRKRAYASLVALYALTDVLEQSPCSLQKSMTLFRNPQLNEQYEISDLYLNGWHIDVRVVTGGDAVLLPKIHYESDIVPDYYIVVKVDNSLQNAEILGAIDAKNVDKEAFDYHYYSVPFTSFIDYNSFLSKVADEKKVAHSEEAHELFRNSYLSLLDNKIDLQTKNKVLKHIFECSLCRTEFCCFTGFEMVCCHASSYPEILEDHTLGYIGAQNVEDKKYEGKEETVYIGSDEQTPIEETVIQTKKEIDTVGETVSDILDGLFAVDEVSVEENVVKEKPIEIDVKQQENEQIVEKIPEQEVTTLDENTTPEVTSIEDILDEVCGDSEIIPIKTETEGEMEFPSERDTDLQQIEDDVFIDVPKTYPELSDENGEICIIPDESANIYGNSDIEIVEDKNNDDEILSLSAEEDDGIIDLDVDVDMDSKYEQKSEIEPIEEELEDVYPSDEEFLISGDESEIENIEDEIIDEATMLSQEETVQKVIVDYDEHGEPIYSYITGVEQEETIDDDSSLIEEDFVEYKEEEQTSEIEDISNIDEEQDEYESVYEDDTATNEEETYENVDENNLEDDYEEEINDEEKLEYEEEVDDEAEKTEDEEPEELLNEEVLDEEDQPSIIDDVIYKNTEAEENSFDGEQMEADEDVNSYDENEEYEYDEDDEEYDDEYDEDFIPEENVKKSSNPFVLIISLLVLLGLAGGGIFFWLNKGKIAEEQTVVENANENTTIEVPENSAVTDMFEQPVENETVQAPAETQTPAEIQTEVKKEEQSTNNSEQQELPVLPKAAEKVAMPELTEGDLIKPIQRNSNGDINKTIVNAFATNTSPVSLRELNWFCASELFTDKNFKNYLQNVDNTLKQNLKSNFMNLVESSPKDTVVAKFAVDKRGNLKKVIISETSGSADIDNVVLQSIKETFETEKSQILNDNELKQDMYYLKVAIKL